MLTEMTVYWKDLTKDMREQLVDNGFNPTKKQRQEDEPIGILNLDS